MLSNFFECLSRHQSPSVLVPALRTVGNIVTGDDMQTQIIINCGALPCLLNLLQTTHKKSIKKEACWTLSNITAGTKDQIQAVFDAGIIPPLVNLLATAEFDIKKESAWAISNATSGGTREQIKYLVQTGCIRPLCDLLTCTDTRIVSIALEGLENILKVGIALSAYQLHPSVVLLLCEGTCFCASLTVYNRYMVKLLNWVATSWIHIGFFGNRVSTVTNSQVLVVRHVRKSCLVVNPISVVVIQESPLFALHSSLCN